MRSNRFWIGEPATRSAKPPPEEWPTSVSGAVGAVLRRIGDEIGEIVLELADIADVAARARRAVAAHVDRKGLDAARRQRLRQRVDGAAAGAGGAVHDDGRAPAAGAAGGIVAEAEPGAVARLEPLDRGQGAEIDGAAGREIEAAPADAPAASRPAPVSSSASAPTAHSAHLTSLQRPA